MASSSVGIENLIAVAQMKSSLANDEALHGADKERDIIKQQRDIRAQQAAVADKFRDKIVTYQEQNQISQILRDAGVSAPTTFQGNYQQNDAKTAWGQKLGTEGAERQNQDTADAINKALDDKLKDLEDQSKLDSFAEQKLMADYSESQGLASSVLSKLAQAEKSTIDHV
ncbi:MAG: hypothetical protein U1E65_27355 [Myxococcota bacterium]